MDKFILSITCTTCGRNEDEGLILQVVKIEEENKINIWCPCGQEENSNDRILF